MSTPGHPPALTRRQGLAAVAALAPLGFVAACSTSATTVVPTSSASPTTPGSVIAAQELALIGRYDAIIAAFPELAASLSPIAAQHRQHAAELGVPQDTPPGPPPATPTSATDALEQLTAAERKAMRACIDACVSATEPGLARTLAFIGASEGSHVPELRAVRP